MAADDTTLIERVRSALDTLAAQRSCREVRMFGGLAFMVDDALVVSVRRDGDLLVRTDPTRSAELLARSGAAPAQMRNGRPMSAGWIAVAPAAVASDDGLGGWLGLALEYLAAR